MLRRVYMILSPMTWKEDAFLHLLVTLNIQPVVVVRGLKRQQAAALPNFVGCFLLPLLYFFFPSLFCLR